MLCLKSGASIFPHLSKGKGVAASTDTEKGTVKEIGDAATSPHDEITSTPAEEVSSQSPNPPEDSTQVLSYKRVQTKTIMVDRVVRVSLS